MSVAEKLRSLVGGRRYAYQRVFDGPHGEAVLKDLVRFCRASETTYNKDPRLSDILIGRREVFLRIQDHLGLSEEEIFEKYR